VTIAIMPDERPRIILEKSKTVKRRYQRSNQRFQFTAAEIARLDREQEREKKAKQLRDREKKRIATKKRKAEEEARAREERKRRGIPDPHAPRVPSSQPLLSMFLGTGKSKSIPEHESKPTIIETNSQDEGDVDSGSAAGDTEAESDAFDDLDEELEHDLSELDPGVPGKTQSPANDEKNEDEFSECSAFDEHILNQADTATTRTTDEGTKSPSLPEQTPPELHSPRPPIVPTVQPESSFGGSFLDDPADFLEAEAAITQTTNDETKEQYPVQEISHLQPLEQPRRMPALSLGSSFRDETADWIEEVFAHGSGDPFGQ
jgi:hypothetical protein